MTCSCTCKQTPTYRKERRLYLAFFWIAGLISGVEFSLYTESQSYLLMRNFPLCDVSLINFLTVVYLPFVIVAVSTQFQFVVNLFCFAKAFLLSYFLCGLSSVYCSCSWLFCLILLFRDFTISYVLFLQNRLSFRSPIVLLCSIILLIFCIEYQVQDFLSANIFSSIL